MYYLLVSVVLILSISLSNQPSEKKGKKENEYTFIICAILVLLAAFRSDNVGADTMGYRMIYQDMGSLHSIEDIVERHSIDYLGYFLLSKLFHMLGFPVQVWFGFVEAFYLYALMKLINRFSKDKLFSLLVFITIGLFNFSLAGLKQTMSMSIMMLAFLCFIDKRFFLSAILVCASYYTHQVALIFLGAFPLYYIRNVRWLVIATLVICFLIYSYSFLFMETMVDALGNERWEQYLVIDSRYSSVTLIFYIVITLIAGLNMHNYAISYPHMSFYFLSLSILGCGIQLFAGVSPSLFRLAFLYTPFLTLLLPNASYFSNQKQMVKTLLIGCIVFYFLYTNRYTPYSLM